MKALPATSPEGMAASARVLVAVMLALIAVGVVMVFSATAVGQLRTAGESAVMKPLTGHLMKVLVALLAFLLALRIRPRQLYAAAAWAWVGGVALLILVLIIGVERNGSRRWLDVAGMSLQPSEFARVATIVVLGAWMAAVGQGSHSLKDGVLRPFALALLPAGLVLVEPDFGSCVYLLFMAVLVLWVGGARSRHLLGSFLPALAGAATVGFVFFDHFRARIDAFLAPGTDYQVRQGLSALGSGGVFGVGLGRGIGTWGFLPEAEDDFVYAVVGEELGLIGTGLLIVLYGLFLWHGLKILLGLKSRFALIVGSGLLLQVLVQAVMNIAVVTAAAPNKGLPLPFVSAGGSSMMALAISVGLLLGLARHPEEDPVREARYAASLTPRGEASA